MKTSSATACWPPLMPVCAIAAAPATMSRRFLGLRAERATPAARALIGVKLSSAPHPLRGHGFRVSMWTTAPLPERDEDQEQPEDWFEPVDPVGGLPLVACVRAAGEQEDDSSGARHADQPADEEGRAVGAAACRDEHRDDGDDRERADRDADRCREQIADRLTHRLPSGHPWTVTSDPVVAEPGEAVADQPAEGTAGFPIVAVVLMLVSARGRATARPQHEPPVPAGAPTDFVPTDG